MESKVFDNKLGFRPSGDLLKHWAMLPQVTTTIEKYKVPSLFGNIKSVRMPIIMVILLVLVEFILIFQLYEEGVGFLAILAISIFDFVIAILPAIILMKLDLIPAQIEANIFINNEKRTNDYSIIPEKYNGNREHYKRELRDELKKWKRDHSKTKVTNYLSFGAIILLNVWKFIIYYEVLGEDIFYEAIGRFILTVILLSIIVHILFTKVVYLYWRFNSILKEQLQGFDYGDFKIQSNEINASKELEFEHTFRPAYSNNQRIAQKVNDPSEANNSSEVLELEYDGIKSKYRVDKFNGKKDIYLIYTGLLTDAEIQGLYTNQKDSPIRRAIVASCKETQLSQLIND